MKSVLVMLSQSPLAGQSLLESLSAVMVLATYGLQVQVVLTGDAVGLLRMPIEDHVAQDEGRPFKSPLALIESFEFYDLLPLWVDRRERDQHEHLLQSTTTPHLLIDLSPETLNTFDGVLRW